MASLSNFNREFNCFTVEMWNKIKASEHKHKNDSLEVNKVQEHFIDEILECFNLQNTKQGSKIKNELMIRCIDKNELVDVANLAFAMTLVNK